MIEDVPPKTTSDLCVNYGAHGFDCVTTDLCGPDGHYVTDKEQEIIGVRGSDVANSDKV